MMSGGSPERAAYLGGMVPFDFTVVTEKIIIAKIVGFQDEGKSFRAIKATLALDLSLDAISRIVGAGRAD